MLIRNTENTENLNTNEIIGKIISSWKRKYMKYFNPVIVTKALFLKMATAMDDVENAFKKTVPIVHTNLHIPIKFSCSESQEDDNNRAFPKTPRYIADNTMDLESATLPLSPPTNDDDDDEDEKKIYFQLCSRKFSVIEDSELSNITESNSMEAKTVFQKSPSIIDTNNLQIPMKIPRHYSSSDSDQEKDNRRKESNKKASKKYYEKKKSVLRTLEEENQKLKEELIQAKKNSTSEVNRLTGEFSRNKNIGNNNELHVEHMNLIDETECLVKTLNEESAIQKKEQQETVKQLKEELAKFKIEKEEYQTRVKETVNLALEHCTKLELQNKQLQESLSTKVREIEILQLEIFSLKRERAESSLNHDKQKELFKRRFPAPFMQAPMIPVILNIPSFRPPAVPEFIHQDK